MSALRLLLAAVTAALLSASPASAATLPAVTLPVQVSGGAYSIGLSTLKAETTAKQATVTLRALNVSVAKGGVYRTTVCLELHPGGGLPATSCQAVTTSTFGALARVTVAAPVITRTMNRPAPGKAAFATALVTVEQKQSNGTFKEAASTWPAAGRDAAVVMIPDTAGQTPPPPGQQGVTIAGLGSGGVNTGQPDSMCSEIAHTDTAPRPTDLSTTALGAWPAYYEVGEPTGAYAGKAPRGIMMLIHGGGWRSVGSYFVAGQRSDADRWRARGWRTVSLSYRACAASIFDVLWLHDTIRKKYGNALPMCALGGSAGGHLALWLAAVRPLSCAISQAGIADPSALPRQTTPVAPGVVTGNGPRSLFNIMVAAFGAEAISAVNPQQIGLGRTRVLFAVSADDYLIPTAQATDLRAAMLAANPDAYADAQVMEPGPKRFVHGTASDAALADYYAREEALVAPLTGG